jgi:hypothetical protein
VHRCTPVSSYRNFEEAYLFFLAFFFAAILFSSELFRFIPPALPAERVFISCIESDNYLVKGKVIVIDEKSEMEQRIRIQGKLNGSQTDGIELMGGLRALVKRAKFELHPKQKGQEQPCQRHMHLLRIT